MPANTDLRWGLRKAGRAVTSLLGHQRHSPGTIISGPQLVRRTTHVSFDPDTRSYQGVPTRWQSKFEELLANADTTTTTAVATAAPAMSLSSSSSSSASASSSSTTTTTTTTSPAGAGAAPVPVVWFDRYGRRFVNLPAHWRERLQRNGLTEWAEFQRNPSLLSMVFSLMDEELRAMDLESLGLDATFYSSASFRDGKPIGDVARAANTTAAAAATAEAAKVTAASGSSARGGGIVWTQQRSFVRDDDSDSEEVAEL